MSEPEPSQQKNKHPSKPSAPLRDIAKVSRGMDGCALFCFIWVITTGVPGRQGVLLCAEIELKICRA